MDRTDPNTWTKDFAKSNRSYCFDFLAETNMLVVKYMKEGNYTGAVAGIDRILNGLIVIQNSGAADCKPHLCMFSWCNADIILHCVNDAPDYKRKEIALANYEDAYDFAKSASTKDSLRLIISNIKGGVSVSDLKYRYARNCPQETIETLENLTNELIKSGSGTAPAAPVSHSSYEPATSAQSYDPPRKKTFREKVKTVKSCLTGIICLWLLLGFAVMGFNKIDTKNLFNSAQSTTKSYVTSTTRSTTTYSSYDNGTATQPSDKITTADTAYVRPEVGLNLRSAPDTASTKLKLMDCGTPVSIVRIENGWAYVNCEGTYGWCAAEYLNYATGVQVAASTVTTTQSSTENYDAGNVRTGYVLPKNGLNLRTAPGETSQKIKVMRQGTTVGVMKVENGWAYVNYGGIYGWCSAEYLNITE